MSTTTRAEDAATGDRKRRAPCPGDVLDGELLVVSVQPTVLETLDREGRLQRTPPADLTLGPELATAMAEMLLTWAGKATGAAR